MKAEEWLKIEGIERELVRLRKRISKSIQKVHKLKWELAEEEVKEDES